MQSIQSTREQAVQAELDAQRDRVARIKESQHALLFSPQGLRGLFPTNKISVRLTTKKARKERSTT